MLRKATAGLYLGRLPIRRSYPTLQGYGSLNVTGLMAGTTTPSLQTQSGVAGSVTIVVIP
jgi:hypothetical protein